VSYSNLFDEKIRDIGNYYGHEAAIRNSGKTLGALGEAGSIIVSKSILYNVSEDPLSQSEIAKSIQNDLDFIFQTIENSTWLTPTFCDGLAGTGWLLAFLKKLDIINIDLDEFLQDIDTVLNINLDKMIENRDFDILHGYLGLGIYFLKRNKTNEIEKIIYALYSTRLNNGDEVKWLNLDRESGAKVINFGLSHGNASILYFLGKCYSRNICSDICLELIRGLFSFFLNNLQDIYVAHSFFPNIIELNGYKSGQKICQNSRLAWCYGDLGILHAMFLVSDWIKDDGIKQKVLELLLWETTRLNGIKNIVLDAGFCHGTSGIGYIHLNLYNKTGIAQFKKAAHYWREETLKMVNYTDQRSRGFLFQQNGVFVPDFRLLTGLGGVFACLTSMQSNDKECLWNECFFLS